MKFVSNGGINNANNIAVEFILKSYDRQIPDINLRIAIVQIDLFKYSRTDSALFTFFLATASAYISNSPISQPISITSPMISVIRGSRPI